MQLLRSRLSLSPQTPTRSSSLSPRLAVAPPHLQHKHEQTREQKENQWRALIRRGSAPALLPALLLSQERRRRPSGVLEAIQLTLPRPFHQRGGRKTNGGGQIKRQVTQTHLMKKNLQQQTLCREGQTRRGGVLGRWPRGSSRYHCVGERRPKIYN